MNAGPEGVLSMYEAVAKANHDMLWEMKAFINEQKMANVRATSLLLCWCFFCFFLDGVLTHCAICLRVAKKVATYSVFVCVCVCNSGNSERPRILN